MKRVVDLLNLLATHPGNAEVRILQAPAPDGIDVTIGGVSVPELRDALKDAAQDQQLPAAVDVVAEEHPDALARIEALELAVAKLSENVDAIALAAAAPVAITP